MTKELKTEDLKVSKQEKEKDQVLDVSIPSKLTDDFAEKVVQKLEFLSIKYGQKLDVKDYEDLCNMVKVMKKNLDN